MVSSAIIIGIDHQYLLILKGVVAMRLCRIATTPPLISRYPFTELAEVEKNEIWLLV